LKEVTNVDCDRSNRVHKSPTGRSTVTAIERPPPTDVTFCNLPPLKHQCKSSYIDLKIEVDLLSERSQSIEEKTEAIRSPTVSDYLPSKFLTFPVAAVMLLANII
jgi:hypothetical protein